MVGFEKSFRSTAQCSIKSIASFQTKDQFKVLNFFRSEKSSHFLFRLNREQQQQKKTRNCEQQHLHFPTKLREGGKSSRPFFILRCKCKLRPQPQPRPQPRTGAAAVSEADPRKK